MLQQRHPIAATGLSHIILFTWQQLNAYAIQHCVLGNSRIFNPIKFGNNISNVYYLEWSKIFMIQVEYFVIHHHFCDLGTVKPFLYLECNKQIFTMKGLWFWLILQKLQMFDQENLGVTVM